MRKSINDDVIDVQEWRRQQRKRLIATRMEISQSDRETNSKQIMERLDQVLRSFEMRTVSIYWPFRGEPDLRPLARAIEARGGLCCLPIVKERGQPLVFKPWSSNTKMMRGVWNIPIPAEGNEVTPDVLIAPLVGFDRNNFRLGYGGGYFDRTLARIGSSAYAIGVGYESQELQTIYPQPFDVPMNDIIVV